MRVVSCKLVGISPISFSKPIEAVKEPGESHDAFMERTWRQHLHVASDGSVFVPPGAIKNALARAAQYRGESVPGQGKATWTKHFKAGLMVTNPLPLFTQGKNGKPIMAEDVEGERLFLPSDCKTGGGSRVWKRYPTIPEWEARHCTIHLIDQVLCDNTAKVLEYLECAGQFVGLLRFRPINGGYYGRFVVEDWNADA